MKRALRTLARALAVLAASALSFAAAPLPLQAAPDTVVYGTVSGGSSEWPILIALDQGFFAKHGLDVQMVASGSVPNAMNALVSGDLNVIGIATDNIIAAVAHHLPVKMVAPGIVTAPFVLAVGPGIHSWADLKGKTIMLATKQDVTALAFRAMCEANGYDFDRDFSYVLGGSTPVRYAALVSGNVQGSMLIQPFDMEAEQHGMRILATAAQYLKNWVSQGMAVNTTWAATHRADAVQFIAALEDAIRWGYTHKAGSVAILMKETKAGQAAAEHAYDLDFTQWHGFRPDETVDPKALESVIAGVVQMGGIGAPVAVSDVLDPSYAREATARASQPR